MRLSAYWTLVDKHQGTSDKCPGRGRSCRWCDGICGLAAEDGCASGGPRVSISVPLTDVDGDGLAGCQGGGFGRDGEEVVLAEGVKGLEGLVAGTGDVLASAGRNIHVVNEDALVLVAGLLCSRDAVNEIIRELRRVSAVEIKAADSACVVDHVRRCDAGCRFGVVIGAVALMSAARGRGDSMGSREDETSKMVVSRPSTRKDRLHIELVFR